MSPGILSLFFSFFDDTLQENELYRHRCISVHSNQMCFHLIDETLTNLKVPLIKPWKRRIDEPNEDSCKALVLSREFS